MNAITAETRSNANTVIDTFNAKAAEVAEANGWNLAKAQNIILRYFQNTDPDTAQIVAASLLVGDR